MASVNIDQLTRDTVDLQKAILQDIRTILENKPLNEQDAATRLEQLQNNVTIISNVSTEDKIHGSN